EGLLASEDLLPLDGLAVLVGRGVEHELGGGPDVDARAVPFDERDNRVVGDVQRAVGTDGDLVGHARSLPGHPATPGTVARPAPDRAGIAGQAAESTNRSPRTAARTRRTSSPEPCWRIHRCSPWPAGCTTSGGRVTGRTSAARPPSGRRTIRTPSRTA